MNSSGGNGYHWPPRPDPEQPYQPQQRNKIHSVLTALPVIMLIVGLFLYYHGERAQNTGAPLLAESTAATGSFTGLSVVNSGQSGQHYLWFDDGDRKRGLRLRADQVAALSVLEAGDVIEVQMAPTVSGSRTQWAWRVVHENTTLLDASDLLH